MSKLDNDVLEKQTYWFKLCTGLLFTIGGLLTYDYIQEKMINKTQTAELSKHSSDIEVLKSKSTSMQREINEIKRRAVYKP